MIVFLKVIMFFVAAIWGIVLGIFVPGSMVAAPDLTKGLPIFVPILWLLTSIAGFIAPCFLVRFKFYKIAAGLTLAGAGSLFVVHSSLTNAIDGFAWFYMPLLAETVAVVLIAVIAHIKEKNKRENAPAESILEKNSTKKEK